MIDLSTITWENTEVIPTLMDGTAFYRFRIQLSGLTYVFIMNFSTRENVWYLDILDNFDSPLVRGIKLVQFYVLGEYQAEFYGLPNLILVTALASATEPPGLYDLGSTGPWQLVYIPPEAL